MTRHSFRWEGLVFGLFFLAVIGTWSVWEQDVLTPRELSLTASGVLIVLGLIGVAATVWQSRPSHARSILTAESTTTTEATPTPEGPEDEDPQPQP